MAKTLRVNGGVKSAAEALLTPSRTGRESHGGIDAAARDRVFASILHRKTLIAAVALAIGIIAWAAVNLANGWVGFAAVVPTGFRGGGEVAISLARLFAALVLVLIVADGMGGRLRWLASGFVVLGLGQLIFGYIEPTFVESTDVNRSLYEMIYVRTTAGALFVAGLAPRQPPRFTARTAAGIFAFSAACVSGYWLISEMNALPQLVQIESLEEAARLKIAPTAWMTGWHWAFAALPFGLAVTATVAALGRSRREEIGGWLPIGMLMLAGSELHDALWPSTYGNSALMNTADLLRLSMAAVIVVGGTLELRRIAAERAALLAAEQERVQRLEALATLKADFTAMVAHELGHPLSAIRRLTEMLSSDGLDPGMREHALETIIRETDALDTLVADVQTTATVEREDFGVDLRPVQLGMLVRGAAACARSDCLEQPIETALDGVDANMHVLADPDRIGQVLRNLLSNAAKYSPDGTHICLRAASTGNGRVRLEVADHGPGIHPDDLDRIFEKFGRGRNSENGDVSGAGIGLYVSRRIVRAHGSYLTASSRPGAGSVFAFELEVVQEAARGLPR